MAKQRTSRSSRSTRRKTAPPSARRSRLHDVEKCFYIAVLSFAVVLTALLAHGSAYSANTWSIHAFDRTHTLVATAAARNPVYSRSMALQARYDSRPYWHNPKLVVGAPASLATADLAIEHLIPCESSGKVVDHVDSNGKTSYGILQFQDWDEWEHVSGITGDPENPDDAIRMAEWGIQHGMIDHWGCARILGEI